MVTLLDMELVSGTVSVPGAQQVLATLDETDGRRSLPALDLLWRRGYERQDYLFPGS